MYNLLQTWLRVVALLSPFLFLPYSIYFSLFFTSLSHLKSYSSFNSLLLQQTFTGWLTHPLSLLSFTLFFCIVFCLVYHYVYPKNQWNRLPKYQFIHPIIPCLSVIICIITLIITRITWLCMDESKPSSLISFPHYSPLTQLSPKLIKYAAATLSSEYPRSPMMPYLLYWLFMTLSVDFRNMMLVHKVAWGAAPV